MSSAVSVLLMSTEEGGENTNYNLIISSDSSHSEEKTGRDSSHSEMVCNSQN